MPELFNIYCDESCHLERGDPVQQDDVPVMVLGATWCPAARSRAISKTLRDIKAAHGLSRSFEIKWTKVSQGKLDFYVRVVEYFFQEDYLHFRSVLVPDKRLLDHEARGQTHDDFYYKMFFRLVAPLIDPTQKYRVYLDIKDTRSEHKRKKLEQVLRNTNYDTAGDIIERVQQIRSHESEVMQVADLLIGAISHLNRGLTGSAAKQELIRRIQHHSKKSLRASTWLREPKFNLFRWTASGAGNG
jgi:hypothetical protein